MQPTETGMNIGRLYLGQNWQHQLSYEDMRGFRLGSLKQMSSGVVGGVEPTKEKARRQRGEMQKR